MHVFKIPTNYERKPQNLMSFLLINKTNKDISFTWDSSMVF